MRTLRTGTASWSRPRSASSYARQNGRGDVSSLRLLGEGLARFHDALVLFLVAGAYHVIVLARDIGLLDLHVHDEVVALAVLDLAGPLEHVGVLLGEGQL